MNEQELQECKALAKKIRLHCLQMVWNGQSGHIGSMQVPFFRDGFRKVIFSIIIMVIVLFFSRGIMGDRELSFSGLMRRLKKKQPAVPGEEGGSENA